MFTYDCGVVSLELLDYSFYQLLKNGRDFAEHHPYIHATHVERSNKSDHWNLRIMKIL